MPTTRHDARFMARMFSMMAAGFGLLIVGMFLDTPDPTAPPTKE